MKQLILSNEQYNWLVGRLAEAADRWDTDRDWQLYDHVCHEVVEVADHTVIKMEVKTTANPVTS